MLDYITFQRVSGLCKLTSNSSHLLQLITFPSFLESKLVRGKTWGPLNVIIFT